MQRTDAEQRITQQPGHSDSKEDVAALRGRNPRPGLPRVQARAAKAVQVESKPIWSETPYTDQVAVDGRFVGFKTYCTACGDYRPLSHFDEDGVCERERNTPKPPELTKEQHEFLAIAHANVVIRVLTHQTRAWTLYTERDMYVHARAARHHCMQYQLKGGRPDA